MAKGKKTILFECAVFEFNWASFDQHRQSLIDYCYELKDKNHKITVASQSKAGLFESKFNFLDDKRPSVVALTDFFYESLWETVLSMNREYWDPKEPMKMRINDCWCHITESGGYHDVHKHGTSSWSGIFYIDKAESNIDNCNGINRIYNEMSFMKTDNGLDFFTDFFNVTPEDGKLIMFPSYLMHSALTYMGNLPRIVLAFNSNTFSKPT